MRLVEEKSRARINLILDVLGKRDDGYHELEMVMQSLGLSDSVFLEKIEQEGILLETQGPAVPQGPENLAYRAAQLMQKAYGLSGGVRIRIQKEIPVAAGLAGGSGNAAAVLLGLRRLYDLCIPEKELLDLALTLGSDVPYCLMGKTALAKGRGEELEVLPDCPHLYVVLVKPLFGVSTAEVFRAYDQGTRGPKPSLRDAILALWDGDGQALGASLGNVLEETTCAMHPVIRQIKAYLAQKTGAYGALMSGSGPTVFSLYETKESAFAAAKQAKRLFQAQTFLTETVQQGEEGYGLPL